MAKSEPSKYQDLSEKLDEVLAQLQQSDVQLDDAIQLYEQGLKLISQIETHLQQAENTIERLTLKAASNG